MFQRSNTWGNTCDSSFKGAHPNVLFSFSALMWKEWFPLFSLLEEIRMDLFTGISELAFICHESPLKVSRKFFWMSLSEDANLCLWRFIESHCTHGTSLSLTSRCSRMWSACPCHWGHIACTYWAGQNSKGRGYECCSLHTIWCRACHLLMTLWFSISPDVRSAVVLQHYVWLHDSGSSSL